MKIAVVSFVCLPLLALSAEARPDRTWRLSEDYPLRPTRRDDEVARRRRALAGSPPRELEHLTTKHSEAPDAAVSVSPPPVAPPSDMPKFHGANWVAFLNLVLFALRPDPDVYWPARVPRIVWEFVVWLNLRRAARVDQLPPTFYIWLVFLTASTGFVDLFIWAPLYGAFVNFQTCEGGWLQPKVCKMDPLKGYSRLLVSVQSVVGGLVYLHTAVQALHAMHLRRAHDRDLQQQKQEQLLQQQQALLQREQYHRHVASLPPELRSYRR